MRVPQTRLLAALLLAGCAAAPTPAPAPKTAVLPSTGSPPTESDMGTEAWDELPWSDRCPRLIAGLRSTDPARALLCAKELPPECLSLEELRRQCDLLVQHPEEVLCPPGTDDCFSCEGGWSLGSPDVLRLLSTAVSRGTEAEEHSIRDLHRMMIPDHIPGLVALLGTARGTASDHLLWILDLLADNTDRGADAVAAGLLYSRAAMVARIEGREAPPLSDFSGAKRDEATVRLLEATAAPGGPLEGLDFPLPKYWMARCRGRVREPADPGSPVAISPAGARRRMEGMLRDGPPDENDEGGAWDRFLEDAPLLEVAAPEEFGALLARWTGVLKEDRKEAVLRMRLRLGDPAAVPDAVATFPLFGMEAPGAPEGVAPETWALALSCGIDPEGEPSSASIRVVALATGFPARALPLLHDCGPDAVGREPWFEARRLVFEGRSVDAVLHLAGADALPKDAIPLLGLLGDRFIPVLRRLRDERHRNLYWPATAGLAIGGDAAARAEFLGFLGDDRTFVYDRAFDPIGFTLNGDPDALAHWRSRVGSNCCLWFFAAQTLERWYPTMPAGQRVGDPDGMEEICRLWWERWKDHLRWSRLAGGWVPVDD